MKALPRVARLHRGALCLADQAEVKAAADRIAGPAGREAVAGWAPTGVDFKLIHFATLAEAEAMQRGLRSQASRRGLRRALMTVQSSPSSASSLPDGRPVAPPPQYTTGPPIQALEILPAGSLLGALMPTVFLAPMTYRAGQFPQRSEAHQHGRRVNSLARDRFGLTI